MSWPGERTEEALFHTRNKPFEEPYLAQKVVSAAFTSQVKANRWLFLDSSDFWVVTLYRGDKDVPNGMITLPERVLEVMPVYFEMALEAHHLCTE